MGALTWIFLTIGGFFFIFIIISLLMGGTVGNGVGNGFTTMFNGISGLFNFKF